MNTEIQAIKNRVLPKVTALHNALPALVEAVFQNNFTSEESYEFQAQGDWKLEFVRETDCMDPPCEMELVTQLYTFHRRYNIGLKHNYSDVRAAMMDLIQDKVNYDVESYFYGLEERLVSGADVFERLQELFSSLYVWTWVYIYDHSGITISTSSFSCRWDSGVVGFACQSKAVVRENLSVQRISAKTEERVQGWITSDVKVWDDYLTGNIWGFTLEHKGEEVDSCWGFYGDIAYAEMFEEYVVPNFTHHITQLELPLEQLS